MERASEPGVKRDARTCVLWSEHGRGRDCAEKADTCARLPLFTIVFGPTVFGTDVLVTQLLGTHVFGTHELVYGTHFRADLGVAPS